uniref:Poly(A) polymerase catalytic subunit domain-containing protein n=1 Tax=viral metagenome TaxID=1070528 RepID=A0A6C0F6W9_9ZZZZ
MEAIEQAAKLAQAEIDKQAASDPAIKKVMKIVERFIQTHRTMCYGGTAINNLLPREDQFYDFSVDIPDYDFYSETPQVHAAKLADRIAKAGFKSVEVKPGVHMGTFKVFADYIGVADISHLDKPIFTKLWKESIVKDGIHYVPPNFLRMSVYLELSRPRGDVSRWKKVYERIQKLNKHYPMSCPKDEESLEVFLKEDTRKSIEKLLIKEKVVLLGFNASILQDDSGKNKWSLPLDVLATPEQKTGILKELTSFFEKYDSVTTKDYDAYAELVPPYTDIIDPKSKLTLVRLYETNACHSYHLAPNGLHIASIPTLLQFFLAALYGPEKLLDKPEQRFLCVADHLMNLANNNVKRRYKLLTPTTCLGKQKGLIDMRIEKSELYEKVRGNKNSREFLEYFFQYNPVEMNKTQRQSVRTMLRKTLRR